MNLNEELELKIKESIDKNLPKQVGETLQERLGSIGKLEKENAKKDKKIQSLEKEISLLKDTVYDLRIENSSLVEASEEVEKREEQLEQLCKSLENREKLLEVEILRVKLSESEKRAEEIKDLSRVVFRSPVYKSHIQKTDTTTLEYNSSTGYNENRKMGENITKTESEE